MIRFLGASASVLAICTAAHAASTQPLATASVFGGTASASVVCSVSNFSGQTATLASVAVVPDVGGKKPALSINTCGSTLPDGTACAFEASVPQPPSSAFYCDVQDGDSQTVVSNMRVTVHVLDANGDVLQSQGGR